MTLNDLLKRVDDLDKMLIWKEDLDQPGWAKIEVNITDTTVEIGPSKISSPFRSDR